MNDTESAAIRIDYAAIRSKASDAGPITVLRIGEQSTAFAVGADREPTATRVLPVGYRQIADERFRHDPPTPAEMEQVIQVVEDEIAAARASTGDSSRLCTTDPAIRDIARAAGLPEQPELLLSLDAVERTFQRLAAVTLGSPALREGIPSGATFAATLLILREFMHHLGFAAITVID